MQVGISALIVALMLMMANVTYSAHIKLGVYEEYLSELMEMYHSKTVPCHKIDPASVPVYLIEPAIVCKALHIGELETTYELVPVPNQVRAARLIELGNMTMFASGFWSYLASNSVYVSEPLIPQGDYEKGFYTSKNNDAILAISDAKKLSDLSAAVGGTWKLDKGIIHCLGVKPIYASSFPHMIKSVNSQRADIFLQHFSPKENLQFDIFDASFLPINGFKVVMPESYNFFIGRFSPESEKILAALNLGLKKLRESGELVKILKHNGFYNENTKHWKTLPCEMNEPIVTSKQ